MLYDQKIKYRDNFDSQIKTGTLSCIEDKKYVYLPCLKKISKTNTLYWIKCKIIQIPNATSYLYSILTKNGQNLFDKTQIFPSYVHPSCVLKHNIITNISYKDKLVSLNSKLDLLYLDYKIYDKPFNMYKIKVLGEDCYKYIVLNNNLIVSL